MKEYSNIADLEFELLKEVEISDEKIDKELLDIFEDICDTKTLKFGVIVGFEKNQMIVSTPSLYSSAAVNYLTIDYIEGYREGDIIGFREEIIFKIDKDVFDKEFLEGMKQYGEVNLVPKLPNTTDITRKYIKEEVDKITKKKEEEIRKGEEEVKKETEKKEEEEVNKLKLFENDSVGEFRFGKVNKNIITTTSAKFILNNNINKIFEHDGLNDLNRISGSASWERGLAAIELKLIGKELKYTKQIIEKDNWVTLYKVEFDKNTKKRIVASLNDDKKCYSRMKINGVKVSLSKREFILSRMKLGATKEHIDLMNKLTGMKFDLLNLKEISVSREDIKVNIPDILKVNINVELIDIDNFEIEFINSKKTFEWKELKDVFFYGRTISTSFDRKKFLTFCSNFGIKKQDTFAYLKRIIMLNELKDDKDE